MATISVSNKPKKPTVNINKYTGLKGKELFCALVRKIVTKTQNKARQTAPKQTKNDGITSRL